MYFNLDTITLTIIPWNGMHSISDINCHTTAKKVVSVVTKRFLKVILYTYLILKKMNERITDS